METTGMFHQLKQIRGVEQKRRVDHTDGAMVVYTLRLQTIADGPHDAAVAARLVAQAQRFYRLAMDREPGQVSEYAAPF